ncbi:MAG TPA: succinate dehydrogenase [Gammaproteobacteria bacterium]|jgi:fumarate reductase subunit C|nr:hypothetical protein [Arenicellales bacterium]MDP6552836.1 hypothetical protein [Arenicellales bacterium]MDP6791091.1 hypothetical protein [Arenicellales bacterium]MDP6919099.1 hypothetical protein [Arenicellales bacterium]HCX87058.1 succinate dehydrogenase [Gammaproteobacteria bacterium]|tara:strand:- start:35321 stop:35644 length:324 start_codon:yes stop_codon:yes gene_type:complete
MEKSLFLAQRITAMILAPLAIIHLGLTLFAVQGGLTATEILNRTQGNIGWALFYSLFVVCAAIHAPIGLRHVINEWTVMPRRWVNALVIMLGGVLLLLGLQAVAAVY